MNNRDKQRGFTLAELMITIAILAIIATMAAPSMTNMVRRAQARDGAQDFLSVLQQTRTEAVFKQQQRKIFFEKQSSLTGTDREWQGSKNVTLDKTLSKPNTLSSLTFGPMGQVVDDFGTNVQEACLAFKHAKDDSVKTFIVIQKNGLMVLDKNKTSCS